MSVNLKRATLQIVSGGENPRTEGNPIEVQFNPATLKLTLNSRVEGGENRGNQRRQWLGNSSTELAFDLYFDTSEEGTTDAPVSVRSRTAAVEQFLLPREQGKDKQAQPKVRFSWGDLVLDGIIESLTIDFELFAQNGTPLRAKMSVSIKEQDARYQLNTSGSGANRNASSTPPGGSSAGPGSTPTPASFADRVAAALDGESAADFLARNGLDPAAWRGVAELAGNPLSLSAGLDVSFSSGLSVGVGIGGSLGIAAGADVSLEGALGLTTSATAGVATSGTTAAGFALAAAGGVGAALETVAQARADEAASAARSGFSASVPAAASSGTTASRGTAGSGGSATPAGGDTGRLPLQTTGLPSVTRQSSAASAAPPPEADPRSTTYGFGVPLRPRMRAAATQRIRALSGGATVGGQNPVGSAGRDPGEAPWRRLRPDAARSAADVQQKVRAPSRPCGCPPPCGHGRAR